MSDHKTAELPAFARNAVNLASAGLGARGLSATDEFFAPLERMLADAPAVFIEDKFDDNGKWMDGWESRRKRVLGHDHAVVRLAVAGRIDGFDVDTSHFTGNYPPACRIEACNSATDPDESTQWTEVLSTSPLGPSASHYFASTSSEIFTHVRLHIYPDGGVARLRVFGQPHLDRSKVGDGEIELSASLNGGRIIAFSDAHYGTYHRMLAPGRGINMGDGWETRRRRVPGNDWIIVALGGRGQITRAIVDTAFFKGNFPDRCSIQAADLSDFGADVDNAIVTSSMFWPMLVAPQKLSADHVHDLSDAVENIGAVTHVRLNIFPDGGISRLKLFGKLD
ncbi:allantoicase [Hoeflea marina]|uniref:Probable allantoicase n=1 Tax=Hoeflea marina TaxID=274592 RepID=A0A317PKU5_9HYPH|nr:allantoicase [Hoeflea marina]PWW01406.1 allantoicase [Hoeflea marina]